MRTPDDLKTPNALKATVAEIRKKIGRRPFVVSFEPDGITTDAAMYLVREFNDALSFEFVEYAPSGDPACADLARHLIQAASEN